MATTRDKKGRFAGPDLSHIPQEWDKAQSTWVVCELKVVPFPECANKQLNFAWFAGDTKDRLKAKKWFLKKYKTYDRKEDALEDLYKQLEHNYQYFHGQVEKLKTKFQENGFSLPT